MIAARIHVGKGDRILAACDEELLGQTFRENGMRITVSEEFYHGETITEEAFIERMKSVTIMNLVGERAVSAAIREGYVDESNVIIIDTVKHAQVVRS
jgi:hypothetical protein